MTAAELIERIAIAHGLTKRTTREVLATFTAELAAAVWRDGRVSVPGLGTFRVRSRKARNVLSLATPEQDWLRLPAHRVVVARVAKEWRVRA